MAPFVILLLLFSSLIHGHAQIEPKNEAFISLLVTQNGLDFVKGLLVKKAISSIISLRLRDIEKGANFPVVGNVYMSLSNITIYEIDVASSIVKPGEAGVSIVASGVTCNLSMNWYYSYSTWLVPVRISDRGRAEVQVEGMQVGLTLGLENQEGSLKLKLEDCGSYVKDISIKLDGGASWLYQGIVDAFEEEIGSAVENAITKKLKEGISQLDLYLGSLPKEVPVDDHASLNVTFVNNVLLSNSSIGFETNGLFIERNNSVHIPKLCHKKSEFPVSCAYSSKMLGINMDEAVFNSASGLYYDAKFMHWIVDKIPDQSLLNTAGWRFIVPQLYRKYPNHDMNLNISLSSPPVVEISNQKAGANVFADLTIDVLEEHEVIPVACISLVIRASGLVKVNGNNLIGAVKLDDFSMSLKWSTIGNLRMYLVQPVVWTLIETVFLPYANLHLSKGFPLPIIHGFTLQEAEIILSDSRITVCSDVSFSDSNKLLFKFIH
ncbi:putative BPI/LBP family protein At1g04970 [Arachis stenosperma]|uniref:putative BPI/LBP family protein At1g04970 n=1 Tax=Arachis stenosperma TaxID=217475 RepID=UPI0025ABA161|nr:putative BPI/LBP family protein At1g04970 [Arachis stenosperma]